MSYWKDPKNTTGLCWGRQPSISVLEENPSVCLKVILSKSLRGTFVERVGRIAEAKGIPVERADIKVLDKLSGEEKHQGIIIKIKPTAPLILGDLLTELDSADSCLLIVLDHIQDPQNLGAIIRTAEAAGASGVIFPTKRASSPNGTVIKTSAGSALRVPLIGVVNISRTLSDLKKKAFWVVGLDQNTEHDIWAEKMPSKLALVVGSEGHGLSRLVSETCDELRRIPMKGHIASLNASVAAAIGMYEWSRTFMGSVDS